MSDLKDIERYSVHDLLLNGAEIDHAETLWDLISKISHHSRFVRDIGFKTSVNGPVWKVTLIPVIAAEVIKDLHQTKGIKISDENAAKLARETILEITKGVPVGFEQEASS
jgi:hypothetical protein